MAHTQEQLQALEVALARGEKRVTFGDKTLEYRSVDELRAAIRAVRHDLSIQNGRGAPRQIRVTTSKGF